MSMSCVFSVIVLSVHVQEIADITNNGRSPHNLQRLSPAICPDCNNPVTTHTMTELYDREWRRHQSHAKLLPGSGVRA